MWRKKLSQMKLHLFLFSLVSCFSFSLFAYPERPLFEQVPEQLRINNRILLKVDGKPITVMDVVKKMDLLFYRQYPELAHSNVARYQFYSSGWKAVLNAMVDEQLIVADAEEKKIEVSDGDVREELEKLFGPDVVFNLDKAGMTLDEAFNLLKAELTVQKMMAVMVRSKAITDAHPIKLRNIYEKWLLENPPSQQWVYQVLSIKGENHHEVAEKAREMLEKQNVPFDLVAQALKEEALDITLSEEFHRKEKELSNAHKSVLKAMEIGSFQLIEPQKDVTRVFHLKNCEKKSPPSFHEMEEQLKKGLVDEIAQEYNRVYREKLRKHYGITDKYLKNEMPQSFEPFALR